MAPVPLVALALLLVVFLPPLLLAARVRGLETAHPERWRRLALAFAWGGTGAAGLALLAQTLLLDAPLGMHAGFVAIVVVAPVVEELAKASGLGLVRDEHPEAEDGFLYGAAAGAGFAATENLLYVLSALTLGGASAALATGAYRALATLTLHVAASGWAGYGLWQRRRTRLRGVAAPFLLGAILLHAAFNLLAVTGLLLGALAALALGVLAYARLERRVRALDSIAPSASSR